MFFGVFSMQQVHAANVMEAYLKAWWLQRNPASRKNGIVSGCWGVFSYRQPQVNTNLVNVSSESQRRV